MAVGGLLKLARRTLFAKPTPERQLLKVARQHPIRRVVELGVDSIETTVRLLTQAVKLAGDERVSYTALDAFDERPTGSDPLPLREAHRSLAATGAKVRLSPGGPTVALAAQANALSDTDLLLISVRTTEAELEPAWFYLPRMCHPGTIVMRRIAAAAADETDVWQAMPLAEIAARTPMAASRLAA